MSNQAQIGKSEDTGKGKTRGCELILSWNHTDVHKNYKVAAHSEREKKMKRKGGRHILLPIPGSPAAPPGGPRLPSWRRENPRSCPTQKMLQPTESPRVEQGLNPGDAELSPTLEACCSGGKSGSDPEG